MASVKNIKVNGKNCWGVLSSGKVITLPELESTTPTLYSATTQYRATNGNNGTSVGTKFIATLWQGEFYLPSVSQSKTNEVPILTIYSSDQQKVLFKLCVQAGENRDMGVFQDYLFYNGTYGDTEQYEIAFSTYRYDAIGNQVEYKKYTKWNPDYAGSLPIFFLDNASRVHIRITLDNENKQLLMSILTRTIKKPSTSNPTGSFQNALIGDWNQQKFGNGSIYGDIDPIPVVIFNDGEQDNTGTILGGLFPIKVKTFRPLVAWSSDKYTATTSKPLVNTYNFPKLQK